MKTWGVNAFRASGDTYHDLPEINIYGDSPEASISPWVWVGLLGAVAVLWGAGRRRHVR